MALVRRTAAHAPGGRGGSAHGCGRPMGGGGGRPCMPWARPKPQGHFKLRPGCVVAVQSACFGKWQCLLTSATRVCDSVQVVCAHSLKCTGWAGVNAGDAANR